jgi:ABC-type amino acid transport substrate-binding protein
LRWGKHTRQEPGTIRLANLISYSDQSLIHDALADGVVDAFAVDQPIFAWACYGSDSPWRGRIEILPQNLAVSYWYYAAGVADVPSSAKLVAEINRFLVTFLPSRERQDIEKRWQIEPVQGTENFRNEPGNLRGEAELMRDWLALQATSVVE